MADKNILMVPIHLDALYLEEDTSVVDTMVDFSKLPYSTNKKDVNSDTANISENIISQPFDKSLILKAGIHLHWALPDALTKTYNIRNGSNEFPAVPNRWLVTCHFKDTNKKLEQWVVESDYLYPEDTTGFISSINIPNPSVAKSTNNKSFCYLGRKVPLNIWQTKDDDAEYLKPLTAIGYGEPTFAAFYPNCHSVFGFYDNNYSKELVDYYEVVGWYSGSDDHLGKFIADQKDSNSENLINAIKREFKWQLNFGTNKSSTIPTQMICYARLKFAPKKSLKNPVLQKSTQALVTIGNTGTEALSAYIATQMSQANNDKATIEDQIEALHFSDLLSSNKLDIGAKFKEARHGKGFNAKASGTHWTLSRLSRRSNSADATNSSAEEQIDLPADFAYQLDDLNFLQDKYDSSFDEIESLRKQIFADWYKYMISAYPPIGPGEAYINADAVKYYITQKELLPLQAKINFTGNMQLQSHDNKFIATATTPDKSTDSLAHDLAGTINKVGEALEKYNTYRLLIVDYDVKEWPKFLSQFTQEKNPGYILRILALIAKEAKTILTNTAKTNSLDEKDKKQVLDGLNAIVKKPEFYTGSKESFAGITLPPEAQSLLKNVDKWVEKDIVLFNRCLLEACFPQIIVELPKFDYILKQIAGPRYWQPTDPVILVAGDEKIEPTPRHGKDGLLECDIIRTDIEDINDLFKYHYPDTIKPQIDNLEKQNETSIAFDKWQYQPWHPFMLEWQVKFYPTRMDDSTPKDSPYKRNFLIDNYTLSENEVDLRLKTGRGAITNGRNIYNGRSILTSHAENKLQNQIEIYLQGELLDKYLDEQKIDLKGEKPDEYFKNNIKKIIEWYEKKNSNSSDVNIFVIKVYRQLANKDFYSLSQSLDGFNQALMMHKQTMQLKVDEPIGFKDYRDFTGNVREALQSSIRNAPAPLNDFNPVRAGALEIDKLRLVDTFGQIMEIDTGNVIASNSMTIPANPSLVSLPPRLVQPAKLNFRWIAAGQGGMEMSEHPFTSPICGWLLPNNLDNNLLIYDHAGKALGSITQLAKWKPAPGDDNPIGLEYIPNKYLKNLVNYIIKQGADFVQNMITALDNTLEKIEPESSPQHYASILLMGRPIAVVRAQLDLELEGTPALDEGWDTLRKDMMSQKRTDNNFPDVQIPIRIGEYQQLNDSLIGYLKENKKYKAQIKPKTERKKELGNKFLSQIDEIRVILEQPDKIIYLRDLRSKFYNAYEIWDELVRKGWITEEEKDGYEFNTFYLNNTPRAEVKEVNKRKKELDKIQFKNELKDIEKMLAEALRTPGHLIEKHDLLIRFKNGDDIWDELIKKEWVVLQKIPFIQPYSDGANIYQSLDDSPETLTMLIDPSGSVHATSGILPTKSINIPANQYINAMKNIAATFLTTPILTNLATVNLPLPPDQDYEWVWFQKTKDKWLEVSATAIIDKQEFSSRFDLIQADNIWDLLLKKGWIVKQGNGKAQVVARDQRKEADLGEDMKDLVVVIESLLEQAGIKPISTQADFSGKQKVREGWLRLSRRK